MEFRGEKKRGLTFFSQNLDLILNHSINETTLCIQIVLINLKKKILSKTTVFINNVVLDNIFFFNESACTRRHRW